MNNATSGTYEANSPEIPLDIVVGRIGPPTREHSPGQVQSLLRDGRYPLVNTPARWQAREDKSFYIPDMLDERNPPNMEIFKAASDHAVHLTEAEALVADAMHLVRMMSTALGQEGDRRAEQTDAACKVIEQRLSNAYNRIDKHDRRHINLFLAYFHLKHKAEEKGQD